MEFSTRVKIDYAKSEEFKKTAFKLLKVKDIYQLRDRYEGQAYLDSFLIKCYGELAMEKFFNKQLIEPEKREQFKNYIPVLNSNGLSVLLFSFRNSDFPLIPNKKFDLGVFLSVDLTGRIVDILGFMSSESIRMLVDTKDLSPVNQKHFLGVFKTFDKLSPINELSL